MSNSALARMTADITSAYVGNNKLSTDQLPELIATIHKSLALADGTSDRALTTKQPAVSIKKSMTPDYLICLEDGRKLKTLKRHLRNAFGLTPEQYRSKWGLPADYPMTAPNYSLKRSSMAKKIGLGRTRHKKRKT